MKPLILALLLTLPAFTQNPLPPGNVHFDGDRVYGSLEPWVDTVQITVHDTAIISVPEPYPVHDTAYIRVGVPYPVHDTVVRLDTLRDTLRIVQEVHDTAVVVKIDTFLVFPRRLKVEAE